MARVNNWWDEELQRVREEQDTMNDMSEVRPTVVSSSGGGTRECEALGSDEEEAIMRRYLEREIILRDPQEVSRCLIDRIRGLEKERVEYLSVMATINLRRHEYLMVLDRRQRERGQNK